MIIFLNSKEGRKSINKQNKYINKKFFFSFLFIFYFKKRKRKKE